MKKLNYSEKYSTHCNSVYQKNHRLVRDQIPASSVRGRQLTTSAMPWFKPAHLNNSYTKILLLPHREHSIFPY